MTWIADIYAFFARQIAHAHSQGISDSQLWLDPRPGLRQDGPRNLEILRRLPELKALGYPLVVGASRKKFLERILRRQPPDPQGRHGGGRRPEHRGRRGHGARPRRVRDGPRRPRSATPSAPRVGVTCTLVASEPVPSLSG